MNVCRRKKSSFLSWKEDLKSFSVSCTIDVLLLWEITAWGNNRYFASKLTICPKLSLLTAVSRHLSLTTWNEIWVFLCEWMTLHSLTSWMSELMLDDCYSTFLGVLGLFVLLFGADAALMHSLHNVFLVNQSSRLLEQTGPAARCREQLRLAHAGRWSDADLGSAQFPFYWRSVHF